MSIPLIVIVVLGVLLLLSVLFLTALADGALRAINQVRLRALLEQGVARAEAMDRLLEHPHRITSTTLAVNTLALAALAVITALTATTVAPEHGPGEILVAVVVLLVGLGVLVFCQLVPRALALRNPERTAVRITRPLTVLYIIVRPITWGTELAANLVVRLFGIKDAPRNPYITEDDFKMIVNAGEEEGVFEAEEREMIASILRFGDTAAHEVMVPRPDIVAVPIGYSARAALDIALTAGHSRLPVYTESVDSIEGILYTKDLIQCVMATEDRPLAEIARPAVIIPETKNLAELLHELQVAKVHMAVVVDEYGGTAGIVTIEDLLEEIVGEIQDEYDVEPEDFETLGDDEWVVLAGTDLHDVNNLLHLNLNSADYDTLGGYITAQLERLPEAGDEIVVDGVRMQVLDTARRRIGRVHVQRIPPPPPQEDADERRDGE